MDNIEQFDIDESEIRRPSNGIWDWIKSKFSRQANYSELKEEDNFEPKNCETITPEANASIISKFYFFWFNDLIKTGNKKPLLQEDIYKLEPKYDPQTVKENLTKNWNSVKENTLHNKPSFAKALILTYWLEFLISALPRILKITSSFLNPVLLGLIVQFIEKPKEKPFGYGVLYVILIILSSLIGSVGLNYNWHLTMYISMKLRTSIIMVLYDKLMKLSTISRQNQTTGRIVNLMSNDASKIQDVATYLHFMWIAPVSLIVCFGLVWNLLGYKAALGGYSILLLLGPLSYYVTMKLNKIRNEYMDISDTRIKKATEIFQAIKILKFYALEAIFKKSSDESRTEEVRISRKYLIWKSLQKTINFGVVPLMCMATFATALLTGGSFTPSIAFSIISLYNVIKWPFSLFNQVLTGMVEAKVAITRITEFLLLEEIDNPLLNDSDSHQIQLEEDEITLLDNEANSDEIMDSTEDDEQEQPYIEIVDGSFSWDNSNDNITLQDINFKADKGELICIIGSVGAGKTSFINVILNEISRIKGFCKVKGSIAYASQTPFLEHNTLRDNILFEKPYNEEKYKKTIKLCCLEQDIESLIAGDMTRIGERGINVSGGQKARIGLARAVYSDADIYLLDDPLSAVDSHVAAKLFDGCIRNHLRNKITLLVTHQLQFISKADRIVYIENGRIKNQGTYESLKNSGVDISSILEKVKINESKNTNDNASDTRHTNDNLESSRTGEDIDLKSNMIKDEEREFGSVSFSIYKFYFSQPKLLWILALFLIIFHRSVDLFLQFYLANWSQSNIDKGEGKNPQAYSFIYLLFKDDSMQRYIKFVLTYTCVSIAVAIILLIREVVLSISCTISGKHLYSQMFERLLRGTMAFFDTTPKGRIITRLSSDTEAIDIQLSSFISLASENFFQVIAALITIGMSVKWLILLFLPLPFLYLMFYRKFINIFREITRLFSISKAPVFSQINETINGVYTIRAYGVTDNFVQRMRKNLEENQKCFLFQFVCARWLSIRNDLLACFIVTVVGTIAILSRNSISPGLIAMGLSFSLLATELMSGLVRCLGDIEAQMNSVERIKQYSEIDIEREAIIETHRVPEDWPSEGKIEFKNVNMRYREGLPLVLKNITLTINPKEKIGIVGRTGSGKSSLLTTLFSFTDLASGNIYIDGIDINEIGTYDLRKKLSIIPQDPIIFEGTIRRNLDPSLEHSDEELWNVLERIHLKNYVSSLPLKLDSPLIEEGSNFSLGQRQLLCVGRALLRNTKIIVIDEASSSIDIETDFLLQKTIKKEFKDCTILTIAHRLQTILDSDRILVLSNGNIAEFDEPKKLLEKGGEFAEMCKASNIVL